MILLNVWLATDKNGVCAIYPGKPFRCFDVWVCHTDCLSVVDEKELPDIEVPTWEDEPINVKLRLDITGVRKP